MKNIFSKFTSKALFLLFAFTLSFTFQSCIHSPQQAWTPTKRKNMKDKKPRSPKHEQRLKTVRAW
ncbi:MAG: hypothetical protein COZ18_13460 [Flexibacter sp. CG_4_10_14_3_um_filter_32_15]|nr:MAG: hypothetical protein COZ18_13460 [Flexibacter sp. CG_4_10_14_3_um_filter_32_15]